LIVPSGDEGIGDADGNLEGFFDRDRAAPDALGKIFAFDHLHHDEARPFVLVEAVDGGDVGVVDLRQQLGFAVETGEAVGLGGDLGKEDLDGDLSVEGGVGCAPDPGSRLIGGL
jgi:hypothetical protein